MSMNRLGPLYPVLCVDSPDRTARALERLLPVKRVFDTDWYVQLLSEDQALQIGLVSATHDSVPAAHRTAARGVILTIDAEDVRAEWERCRTLFDVAVPLTDEAWGQRHFILSLPGDLLVDFVQFLES